MYLLTDHGVYYANDFSAPGGGDPTWTLINGGLPAAPTYRWLEPDPYRSGTRQYLLIDNATVDELYVRTGGNWSKITDSTALGTILRTNWGGSISTAFIDSFQPNINQDGYIGLWAHFWGQDLYVLYPYYIHVYFWSTDYGATWNLMNWPGRSGFMRAHPSMALQTGFAQIGDYAGTSGYTGGLVMYNPVAFPGDIYDSKLYRSINKGLTWTLIQDGPFDFTDAAFNTDVYQNTVYFYSAGGNYFRRSTDSGTTFSASLLDASCTLGGLASIYRFHALYNPSGSSASTLRVVDTNDDIWKSTNAGVAWTKTTHDATAENKFHSLGISLCHDSDGKLYGLSLNSADDSDRAIWCSVDEGATWEAKAGANAGTAPYTNSIPGHAKAIAILQVFN